MRQSSVFHLFVVSLACTDACRTVATPSQPTRTPRATSQLSTPRWATNEWPEWDPAAVSLHHQRCIDAERPRDAQSDHVETPPVDQFGLGALSVGRGASIPTDEYQRYERELGLFSVVSFWYSVADRDLDCTHRRLLAEAIQRRIAAVQSCSAGGERITVVMDVRISSLGRVLPIEASVAPQFIAMAECVAQRIASAPGPTHTGSSEARARVVFFWPGPWTSDGYSRRH